jgi:hypothetical protein
MIRDQPHYGCPKCGSPKFSTRQSITSYGTESIYCTYTTSTQDEPPDFDIDDTGDANYDDTETGDMDDEKTCEECGHEYTEPVFYGPINTLEDIAERSCLTVEEITPLGWLIELFTAARSIVVRQEPHATVIHVEPQPVIRGFSRKQWTVYECPRCNGEMDESNARVRQAYEAVGEMLDRRQLPVLVRTPLCRSCECHSINPAPRERR